MSLTIHSFLREHREEITRAWERDVAQRDPAMLAGAALRDHVPELLDELDAWVADGTRADAATRLRAIGSARVAQRLHLPDALHEFVDECRLLRTVVLRLLLAADAREASRRGARDGAERAAALARLNDGIDLVVAGAVEYFATERERTLAMLEGADEALRAREAFLRRVVDATPSLVFVKNASGRFVLANEGLARAYGTTVAGLIGKTDADFNPDAEEVAAFLRADREVMATRREKLIPEEPVRTASGEVRWFSTVKVPLVEEGGACEQVLGVATDITERKRAEEALLLADRQKDEFLAMLAHELRNPLGAISSAAHVIRGRLAQGQSVERPLEVLERQIRNSARLLDDLLDVSRITRGVLHLRREEVRVDAVVASAVDSQRALIDAAGHELTVTTPPEPVVLEADPTRLEQVISNLVNNAAKYTPEQGHISIAVEHVEREVAIRVRDDGIGIPPELLPRIFETFVQAEQPLARTKGGLGLGLTLVRRLVEMHGGSVEARSDGPGKGSEFVVRLPARAAEAKAAASARRAAAGGAARRRILIVEDNFDAADLLAEYLGSLGHEVAVAHSGSAAIEEAERSRPEIVLLDIGLPGMDGYEVARRLRAARRGPPPVLIAVTGYGQDEDRRRSRDAGFAHHLTKPFDARALERLLGEVRVGPSP